ncbi:MAG: phosphoglycolate phosphatase [Candidatus Njordarchaeales archaeon]
MRILERLGIKIVKAIVTDVDGTLTDARQSLHLGAIAALRKVHEKGIHVILCSSRLFDVVSSLAKYLGFKSPVIAESGSVIGYYLKPVFIREFETEIKERIITVMTSIGFKSVPDNKCRRGDLAFKRTRKTMEMSEEEILEVLKKQGISNVTVLDSGFAVHINPIGVDKGSALLRVLELINVSLDETIVIGDGNNDIPMFRVAKYSIAPANASEKLKKMAKVVSDLSDGDLIIALAEEILSSISQP